VQEQGKEKVRCSSTKTWSSNAIWRSWPRVQGRISFTQMETNSWPPPERPATRDFKKKNTGARRLSLEVGSGLNYVRPRTKTRTMGQGEEKEELGSGGSWSEEGDSMEFCSARVKARVANYPQWYCPFKKNGWHLLRSVFLGWNFREVRARQNDDGLYQTRQSGILRCIFICGKGPECT